MNDVDKRYVANVVEKAKNCNCMDCGTALSLAALARAEEARADRAEAELKEWHNVFGPLGKSPEECGLVIVAGQAGVLEMQSAEMAKHKARADRAEAVIAQVKQAVLDEARCAFCDGTGKVARLDNDPCPFCSATGFWDLDGGSWCFVGIVDPDNAALAEYERSKA